MPAAVQGRRGRRPARRRRRDLAVAGDGGADVGQRLPRQPLDVGDLGARPAPGRRSSSRPASSALTVITVSEWPRMSCRSRAIRARSSLRPPAGDLVLRRDRARRCAGSRRPTPHMATTASSDREAEAVVGSSRRPAGSELGRHGAAARATTDAARPSAAAITAATAMKTSVGQRRLPGRRGDATSASASRERRARQRGQRTPAARPSATGAARPAAITDDDSADDERSEQPQTARPAAAVRHRRSASLQRVARGRRARSPAKSQPSRPRRPRPAARRSVTRRSPGAPAASRRRR